MAGLYCTFEICASPIHSLLMHINAIKKSAQPYPLLLRNKDQYNFQMQLYSCMAAGAKVHGQFSSHTSRDANQRNWNEQQIVVLYYAKGGG